MSISAVIACIANVTQFVCEKKEQIEQMKCTMEKQNTELEKECAILQDSLARKEVRKSLLSGLCYQNGQECEIYNTLCAKLEEKIALSEQNINNAKEEVEKLRPPEHAKCAILCYSACFDKSGVKGLFASIWTERCCRKDD